MLNKEPEAVVVYWRARCPFCVVLRRGLRRRGIPVRELDIWADPSAAAFVRTVAGGYETVPTVVVGEQVIVNPSTEQVVEALRTEAPSLLPERPTSRGWWRRLHRPR